MYKFTVVFLYLRGGRQKMNKKIMDHIGFRGKFIIFFSLNRSHSTFNFLFNQFYIVQK